MHVVESLSDQLRAALIDTEIPITEIAKATGVHRVNITQFRSGKRDLPLRSIETIADFLGFELRLIERDKRPKNSAKQK
jgi:hypothetical protein